MSNIRRISSIRNTHIADIRTALIGVEKTAYTSRVMPSDAVIGFDVDSVKVKFELIPNKQLLTKFVEVERRCAW